MSTYQSCRDKYVQHDHFSFLQTQGMQGHVFTEINVSQLDRKQG